MVINGTDYTDYTDRTDQPELVSPPTPGCERDLAPPGPAHQPGMAGSRQEAGAAADLWTIDRLTELSRWAAAARQTRQRASPPLAPRPVQGLLFGELPTP